MLDDGTEKKNMILKRRKKNKVNSDKSPKYGLIFQIHNL